MFFTRNIVVNVAVPNVVICKILSNPEFTPVANLSRNGTLSSKGTNTSHPGYTFGLFKNPTFFAFPLG